MAERSVKVDHATLNRWVIKYSPAIAKMPQQGIAKLLTLPDGIMPSL